MDKKSRRGLLRNSATVAAAAAGATLLGNAAEAQPKMEKRSPYPAPNPPPATPPMFSRAVAYGNMLFLAGVGYHKPGTIEDHTRGVLDEIKKNLEDAGSSLQKCMKVSVFLADLKDYDRMNAVYRTYDWGSPPPVRTTTAAAGVPGNSLIEIDVIAYILKEHPMGLFGKWSRRDLLKSSGVAAGALAPLGVATAPAVAQGVAPKLPVYQPNQSDNIFTHIGVRPLINGRGTYTIISGSRSLPEVKQAMFEASHYYVQMDEMMDGIGAELGKLMGAEWGIVTNGAEAAICLATIACVAGANVEKCQALPYIKAKDQVIIPKYSRNPYDLGVRMVGVELVEVETAEELHAKISPRTAMIYVMSGPEAEKGPLSIANLCAIAKTNKIPVLVDAAAEEPLNPNIHLAKGATFVCYSGGKCLRGPQSSGILLGDKALCKAAYFQAAPHHAYGRALKCSKEESIGLLAAVRQWYKRDHAGEQRMWRGWMQTIENRLKPLPSTSFEYLEPADLSNKATRLRVKWDANVLKITGPELTAKLDAGTPRILIDAGSGRRPDQMASSVIIMPYMMHPGDDRIIADAMHAALSNPGRYENPILPAGAPASLAGNWAVTIQYMHGQGQQKFAVEQSGGTLSGLHKGELYSGKLQGQVHGDHVELHTVMEVPGNNVRWTFTGSAQGNRMSGAVNMGESGPATFTAVRA